MKNEKNDSAKGFSQTKKWTREEVEASVKKDLRAAFSLVKLCYENPKLFNLLVDVIHDEVQDVKEKLKENGAVVK